MRALAARSSSSPSRFGIEQARFLALSRSSRSSEPKLNKLHSPSTCDCCLAAHAHMSFDIDCNEATPFPGLRLSAAPGKAGTPTKGCPPHSGSQIDLAPPCSGLESQSSGVPIVETVERPVRVQIDLHPKPVQLYLCERSGPRELQPCPLEWAALMWRTMYVCAGVVRRASCNATVG